MTDLTTQALIQRDRGGAREVYASGSVRLTESGAKQLTNSGIGVSPLGVQSAEPGAINIVEEREGTLHRTIITLTNLAVATVDHTTSGAQGTQLLYTFPRGAIQLLGALMNLAIVGDGTGVTTTAAVIASLGSAILGTDVTLTGTEADLVPSTAASLTASAGTAKGIGSTDRRFDNTTNTNSTQLTANLNLDVPDAGSTANGAITVSGTIQLSWYNHGDM